MSPISQPNVVLSRRLQFECCLSDSRRWEFMSMILDVRVAFKNAELVGRTDKYFVEKFDHFRAFQTEKFEKLLKFDSHQQR